MLRAERYVQSARGGTCDDTQERSSVVPVDPESMSTFVDLCTVNNVDSRSAFRP